MRTLTVPATIVTLAAAVAAYAASTPAGETYTNSIGMKFVRIEPGEFLMGCDEPMPPRLTADLSYPKRRDMQERFPHGDPEKFILGLDHVQRGDFDEKPVHTVRITRPFYMSATEVTNLQYELFDPSHRELRGKNGFSKDDNEAAVFVSWYDAAAFCEWLSDKDGLAHRLPTEAEWEYACRAGTTTLFSTGDKLPRRYWKNQQRSTFEGQSDIVPLVVAETPPNPWGLYDMHGNVEEWTGDWYGPYVPGRQTDPVGYAGGDFKITRGGSHGTGTYYLRSANRLGTLPENRNWLIGFRAVIGQKPSTRALPLPDPVLNRRKAAQRKHADVTADPDAPCFKGPLRYVRIPEGSAGPLYYWHNHDPAVVACPNGDILSIWYTCAEERGRELAVAASRLPCGSDRWQKASPFWDAPDRNDHCPALWNDGEGTIYHFNGLCVAGKWRPLAIVMRTSRDSGATWSKARLIAPEHGWRSSPGEPVLRTHNGAIVLGVDVSDENHWGSGIWTSRDEGLTWSGPGGNIRGIHAAIAELSDGTLYALGRGNAIEGRMAASYSKDSGASWTYGASPFSPISGGQRAAMLRLREGPLLFISFSNDPWDQRAVPEGSASIRGISSIFAAVSLDDGESWPFRRVITGAGSDRASETIDGGRILVNRWRSEPLGYLSVCQANEGMIHLISSWNHYAFNLAWLKAEVEASGADPGPSAVPEPELKIIFDAASPPSNAEPAWRHLGDIDELSLAACPSPGRMKIAPPEDQSAVFSTERMDGFAKFDAAEGFTVEMAAAIEHNGRDGRAMALELFARTGPLTVNHYRLNVTRDAAYYLSGNRFERLSGGLENETITRWRLVVRPDTAVQVYRDEKLLAVRPPHLIVGWYDPPRGSYIKWSVAPSAAVIVDHIAADSKSSAERHEKPARTPLQ